MTATLPGTVRTQAFIDGGFVEAIDGTTFDSLAPATGEVIANVAACGEADSIAPSPPPAPRSTAAHGADWTRPNARPPCWRSRSSSKGTGTSWLSPRPSMLASRSPTVATSTCPMSLKTHPLVRGGQRTRCSARPRRRAAITLGLIVREPVGVVGERPALELPPWPAHLEDRPGTGHRQLGGDRARRNWPDTHHATACRARPRQAGVPAGVFNVTPGPGHVAGKALGMNMDVDMVTFTGSTEVGRAFLRYSADSNLKGIVLECGGKSPQIVMADLGDQLDTVAADLADAAFWNAGQNCSAGSRILVHESIKDDFVDALAQEAEKRIVGEPTDDRTTIGPLIEASALDRVLAYVDQARADGARIVTGGQQMFTDCGGWFAGATVIDNVTPDMSVAREEIFGPVVAVLSFSDPEEALRMANDTHYGLAATVWSEDIDVALRTAREIRAGTVAVNGYSEGDITTPFGGYRMSGFGGRDETVWKRSSSTPKSRPSG